MERLWRIPRQWLIVVVLGALLVAVGAIVLSAREPYNPPDMPVAGVAPSSSTGDGQFAPQSSYAGTPTPNPTPVGWSLDDQSVQTRHTVAAGETLGYIGQLYGVSAEEIAAASSLANLDSLEIGQSLIIPIQNDIIVGPDNKIIPDSELVYGPAARDFDVRAFVQPFNSYLLRYQETVEGQPLNGTDIVQLAADRLMVNPRLLLAALEYQSGWVTQPTPNDDGFPLGYYDPNIAGLYEQLIWAGDRLNGGFYGRAEGGLTTTLLDGTAVSTHRKLTHGTAGVQPLAVRSGTTYATQLMRLGRMAFMPRMRRFSADRHLLILLNHYCPQICSNPISRCRGQTAICGFSLVGRTAVGHPAPHGQRSTLRPMTVRHVVVMTRING